MADPFSIVTGALTIAEVTARVGKYVKAVNRNAKKIDIQIEALQDEIESFRRIYLALEELCKAAPGQVASVPQPASVESDTSSPETLWKHATEQVETGSDIIKELEVNVVRIVGKETSGDWDKLDKIRQAMRMLSTDREYQKLLQRLRHINLDLNLTLTILELRSNAAFRSGTTLSLDALPHHVTHEIQKLGLSLKTQIQKIESAGEEFSPSIMSAKDALRFASINRYFYVSSAGTSMWTGRRAYLDMLTNAILPQRSSSLSGEYHEQKRFVVQGIAGAGKTQFCCKFAQEVRHHFWGIFWIDASSTASAEESWKKIARLGGREGQVEAGKHWLSDNPSPWLLIIDSADSSDDPIEANFPVGDRGCIVITTRNSKLRILGTVGSISLDRLEEDEANDLLQKTTQQKPWDESIKRCAALIAKHLGYLPLALVHAGSAIYNRLCTFQDYIEFFNTALEALRSKDLLQRLSGDNTDTGTGAVTTFDIMWSGLETQARKTNVVYRDAIELMNTFSFMDSNDIRLETLSRAGKNLQRVAAESVAIATSSINRSAGGALFERLKSLGIAFAIQWYRQAPVLPRLLRSTGRYAFDEQRARRALNLLVRMSMLSESSDVGCYSMHPLVNVWMRKRMLVAEQCAWSQAAANVLASSISLSDVQDGRGDLDYRIRILGHVTQVQSFQEEVRLELRQKTQEARQYSWFSWLWLEPRIGFSQDDAANAARFSRVYSECGLWKKAKVLQIQVRDYCIARLGPQHSISVRIQLALAFTMSELGEMREAAAIQDYALDICRTRLGPQDMQTLKVMDARGETYWRLGQFKEAKVLHEEAVNGMRAQVKFQKADRDLLKAVDHLGRVHAKYFEFDKAEKLHREAFDGLCGEFGVRDFDTWTAMDNLAMMLLEKGDVQHVEQAHTLMLELHEQRSQELGREHPYTLWAACNLARIKAKLGHITGQASIFQAGKKILIDGLEVANRNLGPKHLGTIFGRQHYSHILLLEGNYDEAEHELNEVMLLQKEVLGGEKEKATHADRIFTIMLLAELHQRQNRIPKAIGLCDQASEEILLLGGHDHPMLVKIKNTRSDLESRFKG